ncbi:MAG: hypothetical protein AAB728_01115 [Patescibacteria group bacterium]
MKKGLLAFATVLMIFFGFSDVIAEDALFSEEKASSEVPHTLNPSILYGNNQIEIRQEVGTVAEERFHSKWFTVWLKVMRCDQQYLELQLEITIPTKRFFPSQKDNGCD